MLLTLCGTVIQTIQPSQYLPWLSVIWTKMHSHWWTRDEKVCARIIRQISCEEVAMFITGDALPLNWTRCQRVNVLIVAQWLPRHATRLFFPQNKRLLLAIHIDNNLYRHSFQSNLETDNLHRLYCVYLSSQVSLLYNLILWRPSFYIIIFLFYHNLQSVIMSCNLIKDAINYLW